MLDVRWRLGSDDGRTEYAAAPLPGAIYIDLETELSGPPDEHTVATSCRHPTHSTRPRLVGGVRPDSLVVVYDDNGGMSRGSGMVAAALDRPSGRSRCSTAGSPHGEQQAGR